MSEQSPKLAEAREHFVSQWGAIGSGWGISRTMAQVHALLLTAPEPMCTDGVMESLGISRGNAHTNLKELLSWGLIRSTPVRGERREFFEAEKDIWKVVTIIVRERKRREIEPTIRILDECIERVEGEEDEQSLEFQKQMKDLNDFVNLAMKSADTVVKMRYPNALKLAGKLFD